MFALAPLDMFKYHAHIVDACLRELGAQAGGFGLSRDVFKVDPQSGWRVRGGGYWAIDDQALTMRLWGASTTYGRFDEQRVEHLLRTSGAFSGRALEFS